MQAKHLATVHEGLTASRKTWLPSTRARASRQLMPHPSWTFASSTCSVPSGSRAQSQHVSPIDAPVESGALVVLVDESPPPTGPFGVSSIVFLQALPWNEMRDEAAGLSVSVPLQPAATAKIPTSTY